MSTRSRGGQKVEGKPIDVARFGGAILRMGKVIRFKRRPRPWDDKPPPKWVKRRKVGSRLALGAAVLVTAVLGGLAAHLATGGKLRAFMQGSPVVGAVQSIVGKFALCSVAFGRDCVVDGDTIQVNGERIRMVDYDTPQISEPHCASEYALRQKAKFRLLELLNTGRVEIRNSGARDIDKYGRKLRLVLVNGRSVGGTLISEGLAWPWEGHRHAWCEG